MLTSWMGHCGTRSMMLRRCALFHEKHISRGALRYFIPLKKSVESVIFFTANNSIQMKTLSSLGSISNRDELNLHSSVTPQNRLYVR